MPLRCSKCEIKLEGEEPWSFPGSADDLQIIHTPGHTYGHIVLLHQPSKCVQAFLACTVAAFQWLGCRSISVILLLISCMRCCKHWVGSALSTITMLCHQIISGMLPVCSALSL